MGSYLLEHPLEFDIPVKTVSANVSHAGAAHWGARKTRAKHQRLTSHDALRLAVKLWNEDSPDAWEPYFPCQILLVRISPRGLDDDNLRGALKSVRDGLADCMGKDDRDPMIKWMYGQRRGPKGHYSVGVRIEPMNIVARCRSCGESITADEILPSKGPMNAEAVDSRAGDREA